MIWSPRTRPLLMCPPPLPFGLAMLLRLDTEKSKKSPISIYYGRFFPFIPLVWAFKCINGQLFDTLVNRQSFPIGWCYWKNFNRSTRQLKISFNDKYAFDRQGSKMRHIPTSPSSSWNQRRKKIIFFLLGYGVGVTWNLCARQLNKLLLMNFFFQN